MRNLPCSLATVAYAHLRKKERRKDNIVQVARGVKVSNVTSALAADTCYAFQIINVVSHILYITFCDL